MNEMSCDQRMANSMTLDAEAIVFGIQEADDDRFWWELVDGMLCQASLWDDGRNAKALDDLQKIVTDARCRAEHCDESNCGTEGGCDGFPKSCGNGHF